MYFQSEWKTEWILIRWILIWIYSVFKKAKSGFSRISVTIVFNFINSVELSFVLAPMLKVFVPFLAFLTGRKNSEQFGIVSFFPETS